METAAEAARQRTVVLVEPICRGSRLQILANTLSALQGRADVIIVTRRDYQSPHFDELITTAGFSPRILTIDSDLGGAWMKNLTRAEFAQVFETLLPLHAEPRLRQGYDLVFMALDDYLLAYAMKALSLRRLAPQARISCLKYRVEYLFSLSPGLRMRGGVLRLLTRWALFASRARLVCFDERLAAREAGYLGGVLPDPWFGPFDARWREAGRTALGLGEQDFALLSLGKQDRRKGIDFLLEVFPVVAERTSAKLVIVGTIAASFADAFEGLKKRFPGRVLHVNGFVPEADLPHYFAAADAFLLPYSEDFTATSGTLARAAASGVPVLATAHGLVGFRVRDRRMGETFGAHDTLSFLRALEGLISRDAAQRDATYEHCLRFAATCTLEKYQAAVRKILSI